MFSTIFQFFCFRFEPPRTGPPLLAQSQPRQRREHARLCQRHPSANPRTERRPRHHQAATEPESSCSTIDPQP